MSKNKKMGLAACISYQHPASHVLLPNRFVNQLSAPPPSPRLARRLPVSRTSGSGERRGESLGESRLCKEDNEERPLRIVRAELRRRRDCDCSGLSWITTGFSQVPSPPLSNKTLSAQGSRIARNWYCAHSRYIRVDAAPTMRAGVVLFEPCLDAFVMEPMGAW